MSVLSRLALRAKRVVVAVLGAGRAVWNWSELKVSSQAIGKHSDLPGALPMGGGGVLAVV